LNTSITEKACGIGKNPWQHGGRPCSYPAAAAPASIFKQTPVLLIFAGRRLAKLPAAQRCRMKFARILGYCPFGSRRRRKWGSSPLVGAGACPARRQPRHTACRGARGASAFFRALFSCAVTAEKSIRLWFTQRNEGPLRSRFVSCHTDSSARRPRIVFRLVPSRHSTFSASLRYLSPTATSTAPFPPARSHPANHPQSAVSPPRPSSSSDRSTACSPSSDRSTSTA
jgi:hypothetical protein